ncbi:GDP-L-fucose synthase [Candidatus Pseudothioglobus singularis]|jgi:GDP-L-fucose synthase|nr:GDP-L-fucose synthase [Candidatus Pseudothioglobus singularis]
MAEKIYVAGHNGMVGSAIVRKLSGEGCILLTRERKELDLTNQNQVNSFINKEKPNQIYLAAAKVGGINANNIFPGDFIYQNLMIQSNIIHAAYKNGVKKLLFLGSSCIYPRFAEQPMKETELLKGRLEQTNEPYAIAKIAGIKLCESYNRQYGMDYRSVMPTNLFGPNDNFNLNESHVIPALIRKFHEAKIAKSSSVEIWGSGKPFREFLHVDDMADACIHVMNLNKEVLNQHTEQMLSHINVGSGKDISVKQLAEMIKRVTGYQGNIDYNDSMPDGPLKKLLDVSTIQSLGWLPSISLEQGLKETYEWFLSQNNIRI